MAKTPNREQILEKAIELFHADRFKNGDPSFNITPTEQELKENGFWNVAVSMLLRDNYKAQIESKDFYDLDVSEFSFDVKEAMQSGVYISGTTGTGKSDIGMYIADQLMKEGIIVIVFDSSQDWQNRSSIPQVQSLTLPYINNIPQSSIVFDISRLSVLDRQRLIENFSAMLYQHQASEQNRKEFFVFFEEASSYFKEGFMRAKACRNTSMLLSEGRNYGIRFGLIVQFSALVDKTAMRYMKQRYFGFTSEPRDVEYIVRFFPREQRKTIAETLRSLKAGEFVYMGSEGFSKIYIEPYNSTTTTKTLISAKIPEPQLIPLKPIDNSKTIISLTTFALWLIAMLMALGRWF